MRSLKKNMQKLHYSTYAESIPIYECDENGDIIYIEVDGERIPAVAGEVAGYNAPIEWNANISAGKGAAEEAVFGKDIDFTRSISTTDTKIPIDELALFWTDSEVGYREDGTVDPDSADYKVAAPLARGINSLMIAIKALPKGK